MEHQRVPGHQTGAKSASIERRQALMSRYLVEEALRRGTLDSHSDGRMAEMTFVPSLFVTGNVGIWKPWVFVCTHS